MAGHLLGSSLFGYSWTMLKLEWLKNPGKSPRALFPPFHQTSVLFGGGGGHHQLLQPILKEVSLTVAHHLLFTHQTLSTF